MDSNQPPVIPTPASRRFSIFMKIAGICLLVILLHGPLALTHGVLRERQAQQRQATDTIAGIWGRAQQVTGPVLAVPYVYRAQVIRSKVVAGKAVQVEESDLVRATAYFLPETLLVEGKVNPEVRQRGIYDAVVYAARFNLTGHFLPDFEVAGIQAERIDWEGSQVLFGLTDLRGIRAVSPLTLADGSSTPFESVTGALEPVLPLGAKVSKVGAGIRLEFSFEAALQGSERLQIAPVGKTTSVKIESPWADPSFGGAYLPMKREISEKGFMAEWETTHFSRGFPQSWSSRDENRREILHKIEAAGFGVTFAQPVDGYRLAERAQKYGVLFFVLVFAVFFLFEVTSTLRIHPLQYAMVGAALCLFFLGFLALTELLPTTHAYAVAAGACTLMVSLYAWSFLKTRWRTLIIGGGLGATYGYLYFVLKSQDYALLAGTAALFAALGGVMFFTRNVDWFAQEAGRSEAGA